MKHLKRRLDVPLILASMLFLACDSRRYPPAQEQAPPSAPVTKELNHSSEDLTSPYGIEYYVNRHNDEADLSEIWRSLGIPIEQSNPGRCGCRAPDCPGDCEAELIDASLDDGQAGSLVLRICYAGGSDCWYLAFKKERPRKYLGIAQSLDNQYEPPQHRIEKARSERWLVIKELWGRGTGFLQYGERWYEFTDAGLKEVLSYPVSGHSVQGSADDYELKSNISTRSDEREGFGVEIYCLLFTGDLEAAKRRGRSPDKPYLRFAWSDVEKRFVLDESRSKLPKSETDPITSRFAGKRSVK